MKCRLCNSKNTRVTSTDQRANNVIKRYCRCLDCGCKFRTVERYEVSKPVMPLDFTPLRGCKNPNSTLTVNDVLTIRRLHQNGLTNGQLALRFKQNRSTISRIINYKTYCNIK